MNKTTSVFWKSNGDIASKLLLGLFAFIGVIQLSSAQVTLPHYDGLDYPAGSSLAEQSAGGWVINQSATGDMLITVESLTYTGLSASTGNKVAFIGGGEDAIKQFTTTTSGTVYYSYLLKVTDASSSGYFAGLLPNSVAASTSAPGSGSIAATVWVRASANAGNFNLGFSARANQATEGTTPTSLQYSTADYPLNSTVLIVVSYQMVSGNGNDICKMWVNPVPGEAMPAFAFTCTPSTDIVDVAGFFIKQNGNSNTPGVEMDEMRFGLTWEDVTPAAPAAVVTPTLVADNTSNNVDNDIDITFVDDAAWRAAITDVKIGAVSLVADTDYEVTAGNLKLKPSGLNAFLTVSGSKAVSVSAIGYEDALIDQIIDPGAPTANSTASINVALSPGASSTITCTAKDQYNNPVPGYVFKYDATIINDATATVESYTVDGTVLATTSNDVAVSAATDANGIAVFTVSLPAFIDGDDGINIQLQLNDGTTNIGTAFEFIQLSSQTISFAPIAPVAYGSANFNLEAIASSSLQVTYASSNPLVATVTPNGEVTVVGVGSTTITASQSGNSEYNPAANVTQELVVTCAAATAAISGDATICFGEGANLQVAISALETQQYTVVYTDGSTNFTVLNYSSGTAIPVTPTSTTTYSLVSVTGGNPNICTAANSGNAVVGVNTVSAPAGETLQTFTTNDPVLISDLVAIGTSVVWYGSTDDALSGINPLALDYEVANNTTYYAMQTINGCTSVAPLSVTVSVILGAAGFDMASLKCYPNPVASTLNISFSEVISKVEIFNAVGQIIFRALPNSINPAIDVQQLPSSNYFVSIESNGSKKVVHFVKI